MLDTRVASRVCSDRLVIVDFNCGHFVLVVVAEEVVGSTICETGFT